MSMLKHLLTALVVFALPSIGHAACATPSGSEGNLRYATADKNLYFCDGTKWVKLGGGSTGSSDILGPPKVGSNGGTSVTLCNSIVGGTCGGGVFAGDGNLVLSPAGCTNPNTCSGTDSASQKRQLNSYNNLSQTQINSWEGRWRYGFSQNQRLKALGPASTQANAFCAAMTVGGFSDWYVPTAYETQVITENLHELYRNAPTNYRFDMNPSSVVNYWTTTLQIRSSSPESLNTGVAYGWNSYTGVLAINNALTTNLYVRCVRRN